MSNASRAPSASPIAGLLLLVIDTRASHALADGGGYTTRRRECEQAARLLGVDALRDVTERDLDRLPGRCQIPRATYSAGGRDTSSPRTRACSRPSRVEGPSRAVWSPLLKASHASMRDDFEITVPRSIWPWRRPGGGALGARMTGGGFGGSAIALVPGGCRRPLSLEQVSERFAEANYGPPEYFVGHPSAGAARVR